MNAIKIENLVKSFNNFKLEIDSMEIKKGFITGFIGPNGSGKTTTIKLIMGMLNKDGGSIDIFDEKYDLKELHRKEIIGYVGDISGYSKESKISTIKNNISIFYDSWDDNLYKKYMKKFKLNENKTYNELSKGQQKQFELAMTLSHHPKIIIMDEPTANLDPLVRSELLEIIQERIEEDDASVFYSTHITSDLDKIADYLIFIYNGKIMLQGEKDTILENHCIVRGKSELLTNDTKDVFISVSKNSFGFEGLVFNKKEAYDIFGEEVIYDNANLEDLLMYYTRGN